MVLLLGLAGWLAYWLFAGCLYLCIYLAMGIWQLGELAVRACRRMQTPRSGSLAALTRRAGR